MYGIQGVYRDGIHWILSANHSKCTVYTQYLKNKKYFFFIDLGVYRTLPYKLYYFHGVYRWVYTDVYRTLCTKTIFRGVYRWMYTLTNKVLFKTTYK